MVSHLWPISIDKTVDQNMMYIRFPAQYVEGSVIRQSCRADGYFEYCTWRARNFDCNFEWKRSHDAVKIQACTPQGFKDRVR